MRKVTYGGANSLDNFIARSDGAVDWILWGKEAAAYIQTYWQTIDTIIMGRKTYEVATSKEGKASYPGVKCYVFSRTLPPRDDGDVVILADDPAAFVRQLKRKKGKDICVMGGGVLAKSLLEADVIDEIGLNIHPVLLGTGIPLFLPMARQLDLELLECKPFANGCVLVSYRVKHRRHSAR
jgi:dihydrofolate reductase